MVQTPPPDHRALDNKSAADPVRKVAAARTGREGESRRHALLCAACGNEVTDERLRAAIQGSHRHRCINPMGIYFVVLCFHEAPGALQSGTPTDENTWFPGYQWRYAHCERCGEHIGWHYAGIGEFWGLIEEKLHAPNERNNPAIS